MGLPAIGCRTFGRSDCMRLPRPAARMMMFSMKICPHKRVAARHRPCGPPGNRMDGTRVPTGHGNQWRGLRVPRAVPRAVAAPDADLRSVEVLRAVAAFLGAAAEAVLAASATP